ncbi:hypothetical protein A1353_19290 [Methylomonas methanica]|uniref:Uncharacterized protein n=1 Tax=Methylomonas methanica TaxID=421 RepID=A0A177M733_METMH|nr:hypothetical protein [Methylomonas methanica]OAI00589.1 hypothetical protein A1353_19290 [Methylomonas methanica]
MPVTPQAPIYAEGSYAQLQVHRAGKIAAFFALICVIWVAVSAACPSARNQLVSGALAAVWAVGAPVWFWYEYYFIYRANDGGLADSFDHFKHGQQTAIAIWAGLAASLGAFAASDFAKAPSTKFECTAELPDGLHAVPPAPAASGAIRQGTAVLTCKQSAA